MRWIELQESWLLAGNTCYFPASDELAIAAFQRHLDQTGIPFVVHEGRNEPVVIFAPVPPEEALNAA